MKADLNMDEDADVYVAGVASAVVARTSANFPSKEAWYLVTLIKSDAETRSRPIRTLTDRESLRGQVHDAFSNNFNKSLEWSPDSV